MSWQNLHSTLVKLSFSSKPGFYSQKLAVFDLDHTLVKPRSGRKHPESHVDWIWWEKGVLDKLAKLAEEDWTLLVFSNQAGGMREEVFSRVEAVFQELVDHCERVLPEGKPFTVEFYLALEKDVFRKPNTTVFEEAVWPKLPSGVEKKPRLQCFYVGDAAGRQGDFSDSDRKFAYNLQLLFRFKLSSSKGFKGVRFYTPEEFFLKEEGERLEWRGFEPYQFYLEARERREPDYSRFLEGELTVVVMIGPPASGKSTLAQRLLSLAGEKGVEVNQDACGSKDKCLEKFMKAVHGGAGLVVVSNTNPETATRKRYVNFTRNWLSSHPSLQGKVFYFLMSDSLDLYRHLNLVREKLLYHRCGEQRRVPEVAFTKYQKKFEPPVLEEGVDEILPVYFTPRFKSKYEVLMFLQRN